MFGFVLADAELIGESGDLPEVLDLPCHGEAGDVKVVTRLDVDFADVVVDGAEAFGVGDERV